MESRPTGRALGMVGTCGGRGGWRAVWTRSVPGRQLRDLGLVFDHHLMGELANLRQAAVMGLGGGQLAGGAESRRHDLNKGQVKGAPAQPPQPLEVGLRGGAGPLVAVPMW